MIPIDRGEGGIPQKGLEYANSFIPPNPSKTLRFQDYFQQISTGKLELETGNEKPETDLYRLRTEN
jgi:hypothetical protein